MSEDWNVTRGGLRYLKRLDRWVTIHYHELSSYCDLDTYIADLEHARSEFIETPLVKDDPRHWGDQNLVLEGIRYCTSAEIAKIERHLESVKNQANKAKLAREARERKEYERLSKKFGVNDG